MRTFTPSEWGAIVHALRVAADRFEEDVHEVFKISDMPISGKERLIRQFSDQAARARDLALVIEGDA